jgi:hypothetical protein
MTPSWLVGGTIAGRAGADKAKGSRAGRIRKYAKHLATDADLPGITGFPVLAA